MKRCHRCAGVPDHDMSFDIMFCPACNIWLEEQCKCGEDCPFSVASAGKLPETPGMAGFPVSTSVEPMMSIDEVISEQLKNKQKIVGDLLLMFKNPTT